VLVRLAAPASSIPSAHGSSAVGVRLMRLSSKLKSLHGGLYGIRSRIIALSQPSPKLGKRHTALIVVALHTHDDAVFVFQRPACSFRLNMVLGWMPF
jgi:hypothetical protein